MASVSGWSQIPKDAWGHLSNFLSNQDVARARLIDRETCRKLSFAFFRRYNTVTQMELVLRSNGSFGAINFINLQAILQQNISLISRISLVVRIAHYLNKPLPQPFLAEAAKVLFDKYCSQYKSRFLHEHDFARNPLDFSLVSQLSDINEVRKLVSYIFTKILESADKVMLECCTSIIKLLREQQNKGVNRVIEEVIFVKAHQKSYNQRVDNEEEVLREQFHQKKGIKRVSDSCVFYESKNYSNYQLFINSFSKFVEKDFYDQVHKAENVALKYEFPSETDFYDRVHKAEEVTLREKAFSDTVFSYIFQQLQNHSEKFRYLELLRDNLESRHTLYYRVTSLSASSASFLVEKVKSVNRNIGIIHSKSYILFLKSLCTQENRELNGEVLGLFITFCIEERDLVHFSDHVDKSILSNLPPNILSQNLTSFIGQFGKSENINSYYLKQLEDYIINCNQLITPDQFDQLKIALVPLKLNLNNILACMIKRFPELRKRYRYWLEPSDRELYLQGISSKKMGSALSNYFTRKLYTDPCHLHGSVARRMTPEHIAEFIIPSLYIHNILEWTCANLKHFDLNINQMNALVSHIIKAIPLGEGFRDLCLFTESRPQLTLSKEDTITYIEAYFNQFRTLSNLFGFYSNPIKRFFVYYSFDKFLPLVENLEKGSRVVLSNDVPKIYEVVAPFANRDFYVVPQTHLREGASLSRLSFMTTSESCMRLLEYNRIELTDLTQEQRQYLEQSQKIKSVPLFD